MWPDVTVLVSSLSFFSSSISCPARSRSSRSTSAASSSGSAGSIPVEGAGSALIIWPIIDKLVKVSLRTITMDVPPQDIITRDNVTVKVNAGHLFQRRSTRSRRIIGGGELPVRHVPDRADHAQRASSVRAELDELLTNREELNAELQQVIDTQTEPWGIKVTTVEVKNVDLPPSRCSGRWPRQAEAERERRAKIIHAEGEFQAVAEAGRSGPRSSPTSRSHCSCRFLQTLTEIATEKNSTIVFPVPIDILKPFIEHMKGSGGSGKG
ncbi:MAG: SPFH domain-containing protein [Desulfosudis oleivorans]|nr:SPFH domain-containing protein [Desulfosudis oleivorans]